MPSGRAVAMMLVRRSPERGVTSDGLTMTVFPAARAGRAKKGISPAGN